MMAATKNGSRVEGIRGRQLDYVPATIDVRDEMIVRMQLLINDCVDTNVHLLYRPNCIQDVFQLSAEDWAQIDAQTKVQVIEIGWRVVGVRSGKDNVLKRVEIN
ncbi:hypothetical protein Tco_0282286 [Tanacetum coccineum]